MSYKDELTKAMGMLAQHEKTLFVGQSVKYGGQAMFSTFADVPMERRIEFPVAENTQMGFCTGLALEGYVPVCVFPRFDFLLSAADQLVNHLDKIAQISGYNPKVIIRTAVGSKSPLNAGVQHTQDYTQSLSMMLHNTIIWPLYFSDEIASAYEHALKVEHPVILVEYASKYNDD